MTIYASRFGPVQIPANGLWQCRQPLAGFEELRDFALIQVAGQSPFVWLQSLELQPIAFLLAEPRHFGLQYPRPADAEISGLAGETCQFLIKVTIPENKDEPLRPHHLGPLCFDPGSGEFVQWVLEPGRVAVGAGFRPQTNDLGLAPTLLPRLVHWPDGGASPNSRSASIAA